MDGVQDTLIPVAPSWTTVTSLGAGEPVEYYTNKFAETLFESSYIPIMMLAEPKEGLLLDTVQVYSPPVVTVRVWVYCAVTGSSNTVSVPSVTLVESLVQVTVVAGPPVEMQVKVSRLRLNVTPPSTSTSPSDDTMKTTNKAS